MSATYELNFMLLAPRPETISILKELLTRLGVSPLVMVEYQDAFESGVVIYFQRRDQAGLLRKKFARWRLPQVKTRIRRLSKASWFEKWKTDVRPFALTKRLVVVPAWWRKKVFLKKDERPLILDATHAFGSGLHETTQFMAYLIERMRGQYANFLDVGTGSGILSLVAWSAGTKEIFAVDRDPLCIRTVKENFVRNGASFKSLRRADISRLRGKRQFDFVAANLITQDLIRVGAQLLSFVRPGKYLAVSGITLRHLPLFQKAYRQYPLRCLKILRGKQWAALLYKVAES